MYQPTDFTESDRSTLLQLVDRYPFATLVSNGMDENSPPFATHLPLLRDGEDRLIGHFARANPHAGMIMAGPVLAIFAGPHAYISPSWYRQVSGVVPTWNYAAVHVRGRAEPIDDDDQVRIFLDRLTKRFEGPGGWQTSSQDGRFLGGMRGGVNAFAIQIDEILGKRKMSQNRTADDRRGVVAGLRNSGDPESERVAEMMISDLATSEE